MKLRNLLLVVLCLSLLLALAACVEAKAGDREVEDSTSDTAAHRENSSDPTVHGEIFSPKTPIDSIDTGRTELPAEEGRPFVEKSPVVSDGYIIDLGDDYDPGEIPTPKPVEPTVELQSEESTAEEE